MKKTIIAIVVLALIGAGVWYSMNRQPSSGASGDAPTGTDTGGSTAEGLGGDTLGTETPDSVVLGPAAATEVKGTVTAIDLEQAMVDGPYVVTVKDAKGAEYDVAVPSMGIRLCAGQYSIMSPTELKVGDKVEVSGTLTAEGTIVPCESLNHYLRKSN